MILSNIILISISRRWRLGGPLFIVLGGNWGGLSSLSVRFREGIVSIDLSFIQLSLRYYNLGAHHSSPVTEARALAAMWGSSWLLCRLTSCYPFRVVAYQRMSWAFLKTLSFWLVQVGLSAVLVFSYFRKAALGLLGKSLVCGASMCIVLHVHEEQ